ncbi:hypothetical protein ACFE04_027014 [Oxalis oulophora]
MGVHSNSTTQRTSWYGHTHTQSAPQLRCPSTITTTTSLLNRSLPLRLTLHHHYLTIGPSPHLDSIWRWFLHPHLPVSSFVIKPNKYSLSPNSRSSNSNHHHPNPRRPPPLLRNPSPPLHSLVLVPSHPFSSFTFIKLESITTQTSSATTTAQENSLPPLHRPPPLSPLPLPRSCLEPLPNRAPPFAQPRASAQLCASRDLHSPTVHATTPSSPLHVGVDLPLTC